MSHHGFIPSSAEDALRRRVKAEIRKRMRGLRNTMPPSACAQRSARIVERLESMAEISTAATVALFWPIEEKHEVDLRAIDQAIRARGGRVAYPSIDPETREMTFRIVSDVATLEERGLGFREPPEAAPEVPSGELSTIVVPALAIDPTGHRIGYGAGFYDRTLARYANEATTLGVAFDYQLISEVPVTSGDTPVAWIVTDGRTLRAEPRAPDPLLNPVS